MVGTIVNALGIVFGSIIGSVFKKGIKEQYQESMLAAMGLAAMGIGINAIVGNMPQSKYPALFIVALAIGSLLGSIWNLEGRFKNFLAKFSFGDSKASAGVSTAILLSCMGSLSILGPIESAIHNNESYLFTNAALDFITAIALASTYGISIMIAAGALLVWQTSIYVAALYLAPYMTGDFMTELSIIGGFMIMASGLSILKIKEFESMNLLPSLIVPIVWFIIINVM